MRNLKKILSVLLVVAMVAISMVPAFAADTSYTYEAQAKALYDVNLFKGVSPDSFVPDLGSAVTREQGIAIVVRLLGKDKEAAALSAADADAALAAYTDVKDIEPSLKNSVAYAVKNKLVVGATETTIDPKGAMTGNQLATILLRNLKYTVDDKAFDTAAATLSEKGGLNKDQVAKFATKELIRDDLVGIAYGSLQAKYSDSGKTVIDQLIADGVVTKDAAVKAGIIAKPVSGVTATVTGVKQMKVDFGTAVDTTKATVTVKKGSATPDSKVTFADDKTSATVDFSGKLTKGDYTVTVSGVSDKDITVTVNVAEDEKVAKVEINGDKALLVRDNTYQVTVAYKLYNQYNEDVTKTYYSDSTNMSFNTGRGQITKIESKKLTIQDTTVFKTGESFSVSVLNSKTGAFASKVMTVSDKAQVSEVTIEKLYNADNKTLKRDSDFSQFKLIFSLKDQYGNNLTDLTAIKQDMNVRVADDKVTQFATTTVSGYTYADFKKESIDGTDKITLALVKPTNQATNISNYQSNTTTLTAISTASGKMATFDVVVKETIEADTVTLEQPDFKVADEKIKIPFTALDQFGNEITKASDMNLSTLTASSGDIYIEQNVATDKPELILDATGIPDDTNVTIMGSTKTNKTFTMSLTLDDKAVPTTVIGIKSDYNTKILDSEALVNLKYDKILIQDQYGRTISSDDMKNKFYSAGYTVKVESDNAAKLLFSQNATLSSTAATYSIDSSKQAQIYPVDDGSVTVTFTLQKNGADVSGSDKDITFSVVSKDDIDSYEVADIGSVYDTDYLAGAKTATDGSTIITAGVDPIKNTNDYAKEVKVTGIMADGSKVTIPYASGIYAVTVDSAAALLAVDKVADPSVASKVYAANPSYATADTNDVTVPLTVTVNGKKTQSVQKTFTISRTAPKMATLSLVTSGIATLDSGKIIVKDNAYTTIEKLVADAVKTVDSYGVENKNEPTGFFTIIVSNIKNGNDDSQSDLSHIAAGYTFDVTAIAKNGGQSITFKVGIIKH